jgi:WD40 repeat protein
MLNDVLNCDRSMIAKWRAQFGGGAKIGPVINRILLHPSNNAIITAGTRGPVRVWDIQNDSYNHLSSINPFQNVALAAEFFDETVILGGLKDGGVENACGLPAPIIFWDLSRVFDNTVNNSSWGNVDEYDGHHISLGAPRDIKKVGSSLFFTFLRVQGPMVVQMWKRGDKHT